MRAAPTVAVLVLLLAAALLCPTATATAARYTPRSGDGFHYAEVIRVGSGVGNYTGYTDITFINGSLTVTAVATNGTESASYANAQAWRDNQGGAQTAASSGNFTFSASSLHYVHGTDNQTGYVNPYVWFYIDNTLAIGAQFFLLNTPFIVQSRNASAPTTVSPSGYAEALLGLGTGAYQRDDAYGVFTANYTWAANFDPTSGYIVSYEYTEFDHDSRGDGFTYTDSFSVTQTSYPLVPTNAPPPPPQAPAGQSSALPLAIALVAFVVVIVVLVALVVARRNRLPRHGMVPPTTAGWTPPPLDFGAPASAAPQVVLRETVKVNCRYCGTLIDSTATACPKCGAPRL